MLLEFESESYRIRLQILERRQQGDTSVMNMSSCHKHVKNVAKVSNWHVQNWVIGDVITQNSTDFRVECLTYHLTNFSLGVTPDQSLGDQGKDNNTLPFYIWAAPIIGGTLILLGILALIGYFIIRWEYSQKTFDNFLIHQIRCYMCSFMSIWFCCLFSNNSKIALIKIKKWTEEDTNEKCRSWTHSARLARQRALFRFWLYKERC